MDENFTTQINSRKENFQSIDISHPIHGTETDNPNKILLLLLYHHPDNLECINEVEIPGACNNGC